MYRYLRIVFKYKVTRKAKQRLNQILKQDNNIHSIAMGFAVGVFIGTLPILGHMLIALVIASFFRYNTIAAVSAVWVANPFTYVPLYFSCYWFGAIVTKAENTISLESFADIGMEDFFQTGIDIMYPLFIGSLFIGALLALLTYFFSKRFLFNFSLRRK